MLITKKTAAEELDEKKYLIVKTAYARVLANGGNPANQSEMKKALRQVELEFTGTLLF
jgi:hypothetical protein